MKITRVVSTLCAICVFVPLIAAAGTSAISGHTGNVVVTVARHNGVSRVTTLQVLEKTDNPCYVRVGYQNGETEETDKCIGGKSPGMGKGRVTIPGNITGIKVCTSNKRVKGYTLFGTNGGDGSPVADTFERPNCRDNWRSRADCPPGQIARGFELHFNAGTGNKSDDLTGVKLVCE